MALERQGSVDSDSVLALVDEVMPLIERYMNALFPLIEHRSVLWEEETDVLASLAAERLLESGFVFWSEILTWPAWYIANACGGFAVAARNLDACRSLLQAPVAQSQPRTLGTLLPGESGVRIGRAAMQRIDSQNWYSPHFEHLLRTLGDSEFLRSTYPEFAGDGKRLLENLTGFSLLATLFAGMRGFRVDAYWTIFSQGGVAFATTLLGDSRFRARVADVLDLEVPELEERARDLLEEGGYPPAGWNQSDVELVFRRAPTD
jgi:hypothetical protein